MIKSMSKLMTPMVFAGAATAAIALAPMAAAEPCLNPDGTACEFVKPDGAGAYLPAGVQGGADANAGTVGGTLPGGVWGEAGPDGAQGCVPVYGCRSFG